MGCQKKTSARKLQVVSAHYLFSFKNTAERYNLVFYLFIFIYYFLLSVFRTLFCPIILCLNHFSKGEIFISGRLSLVPWKRKKQVQIRETSSKRVVIPIVSVYSSHRFRECDKYLFESSIGIYFFRLQQFKCDAKIGYSDTVIYYIELLFSVKHCFSPF